MSFPSLRDRTASSSSRSSRWTSTLRTLSPCSSTRGPVTGFGMQSRDLVSGPDEPPAAALAQEPVVAEVVVGVVDGHGERDAAPQCAEVVVCGGRDVREFWCQFDVVVRPRAAAVASLNQGHRAQVADPLLAASVEPVQQEDGTTVDPGDRTSRNSDPDALCQVERRLLPGHDVPVVVRVRELGGSEQSVLTDHRRLGSGPAEGAGPRVQEDLDGGDGRPVRSGLRGPPGRRRRAPREGSRSSPRQGSGRRTRHARAR